MTKFLLPIAINVINKAVDKIPEDLEGKIKEFVIGPVSYTHLTLPTTPYV